MSRIQSSVGLITGIKTDEVVNQLMTIAARPRDLLNARVQSLDGERLAVAKLTSLMLAFQFETNRLATSELFQAKAVTSSDTASLTATVTKGGNPAVGSYQFRPLQTATAQQLASGRFQSLADLPAEGTLTFGFGGFVDKGISLDELNAGAGVRLGSIRIIDRANNTVEIDLRLARTVDDVLNAVNNNGKVAVTAVADGDSIRLIDSSGESGNLKVQEIGLGKTALDLGLAGISVAANEATGSDVLTLHDGTRLTSLNDGNGVPLAAGDDLAISLADSTTVNVDLGEAGTLGEVLAALNAAQPTKFSAAINADGNRIELTDLTSGGGTLKVSSVGVGTAAETLGLTTTAVGNAITGGRLISGLRDTLISSLRGGRGLGTLGTIGITNRAGVSSNVDLSGAETVEEIVQSINDQAVGVSAAINSARNGIVLTDTTAVTSSNLIVVDGDASKTATALGVAIDKAARSVNSGTLGRQQISRATLLSSLKGGRGIDVGDLIITDSNGVKGGVDLNTPGNEATTIGDVIDRINAITTAQIEARINDTGDGILLVDNAGGTDTLQVREVGRHTTAADLRLLGTGVDRDLDGTVKQVIDGTARSSVDLSDLSDAATSIPLSSLNGGKGVSLGSFRITDRAGDSAVVVLNSTGGTFKTVADVIHAINSQDIDVAARINDAGTGILLYDTGDGTGTLEVEELAGGTTAANLGLNHAAVDTLVDDLQTQAINGAGTFSKSAALTGLAALAAKINNLDAGVTASTVHDGIGYRLLLSVDETGAGRELLVDGLDAGLTFEQLTAARDAVLEIGGTTPGSGVLITSPDNKLENVIPGIELEILAPSETKVSINVTEAHSDLVSGIQDFVDAFNSIRTNLDEVTSFNAEDLTTGILFGTTAVLRVESDLNRILSGRFLGVGRYTSLEAIGLSFDDKGKLSLDKNKLEESLSTDPGAVEQFFTHPASGLSAKLKTAIEQLAGKDGSVLAARTKSLGDIIANGKDRLTSMDQRLSRERERLLTQFARLESTVATLQKNLTALSALQIIPPLTSTSSNR